ncbi:MAG: phosphopentomutase [Actinobacteria bacterium]|nr:phosphopentomutase [Actinomycetota bacterium]
MVVLDACGCGALPDAAEYGDAGTNTLAHLADAVGGLRLPTLQRLGLGNVVPLRGVAPSAAPAVHGRLHPLGPGKDTTTGHWELMGAPAPPLPTYPGGFPRAVIEAFGAATGREVLCNRAVEGIRAIEEHGEAHLRSGALIVYTSQDSVFQVAAHVNVVPREELYGACRTARSILSGAHGVGRVIARPFEGEPAAFRRTDGRRDYALPPPEPNYVDLLAEAGVPVTGIGKVAQVFSGRGFAAERIAYDNAAAIAAVGSLLDDMDAGFAFANLVDTDQVYGHRKDAPGFHRALRQIDEAVARWLTALRGGDMLVLCADHGCDLTHPGTDHTREYAPLLATFARHDGRRADGPRADGPLAAVGASVLHWLTGRQADLPGEPFTAGASSYAGGGRA